MRHYQQDSTSWWVRPHCINSQSFFAGLRPATPLAGRSRGPDPACWGSAPEPAGVDTRDPKAVNRLVTVNWLIGK